MIINFMDEHMVRAQFLVTFGFMFYSNSYDFNIFTGKYINLPTYFHLFHNRSLIR